MVRGYPGDTGVSLSALISLCPKEIVLSCRQDAGGLRTQSVAGNPLRALREDIRRDGVPRLLPPSARAQTP